MSPKSKNKEALIDLVLSRKIRGYSFDYYPKAGFASAVEYRQYHLDKLTQEYEALGREAFFAKYENYIY